MIHTNPGIMYANTVVQFLNGIIDETNPHNMFVNTFLNGRENGYRIIVYGYEKNDFHDFYIWIHNQRNSDKCAVRWGWKKDFTDKEMDRNILTHMYSEKIYNENTKYFDVFDPIQIAKFILEKIADWDVVTSKAGV